MKRFTVAGLLAPLAITSPALAAEYYVAKDTAANKCKIIQTEPDGQGLVMVGDTSYPTKDEAKAARKKAAECDWPKEKN